MLLITLKQTMARGQFGQFLQRIDFAVFFHRNPVVFERLPGEFQKLCGSKCATLVFREIIGNVPCGVLNDEVRFASA